MDPMTWGIVYVLYTGQVEAQYHDSEPWRPGLSKPWERVVNIDSLVVYEWLGSPTAIGARTVKLVISVKL